MKRKITPGIMAVVTTVLLSVAACKNESEQKDQPVDAPVEIQKDSTQAQASAYICPMHCENGKDDAAGQCADCGMDLVANK